MKTLITLLSLLVLLTGNVTAGPWMPWDNSGTVESTPNNYNPNNNTTTSWMPWNPNSNSNSNSNWNPMSGNNNWNPMSGNNNWGPFNSGNNWGPFNSGSNFGPMDGNSNWGPVNTMTNWGPMKTMNNWVNETEFGITFKTKNDMKNKGYARANTDYQAQLQNRMSGKGDWYGDAATDNYYLGQVTNYGNSRGQGQYEGYGQQGYLGYSNTPISSNDFPALSN
jgi:hypothetical protein